MIVMRGRVLVGIKIILVLVRKREVEQGRLGKGKLVGGGGGMRQAGVI